MKHMAENVADTWFLLCVGMVGHVVSMFVKLRPFTLRAKDECGTLRLSHMELLGGRVAHQTHPWQIALAVVSPWKSLF